MAYERRSYDTFPVSRMTVSHFGKEPKAAGNHMMMPEQKALSTELLSRKGESTCMEPDCGNFRNTHEGGTRWW